MCGDKDLLAREGERLGVRMMLVRPAEGRKEGRECRACL